MRAPLLAATQDGLYCEAGGFHVDPWNPVDNAVVTHAHSDHATPGCGRYLCAAEGLTVLRARLSDDAPLDASPYGEARAIDGVTVSLHPAGHILGSSQVRVEHRGEVWVVSGDYKVAPDPTCRAFEPVRCHTFITESTFGLPIYRWPSQADVFGEIDAWRRENAERGLSSVLFAYSLGKAQRVLAGVDPSQGPIYCHGAVRRLNDAYRQAGVALPPAQSASEAPADEDWSRALVIAPPSAAGTPWLRRFGDISSGFASGWMQVRGARRRRSVDRGFVLSDHADWPDLLAAIAATGAERVLVTHGSAAAMARYLNEQGLEAAVLSTRYSGEQDDNPEDAGADQP